MGIIVAYFFITGVYLWILIGVLEYFGIFNKFTMRIISSISLLFVVAGFFMRIFSNQSGFNLAKLLHDIDIYNLKSISITLYVFFIISLLGSLLFIVIIINKKLSIGFDWIPIIIDIGCFVYLKDLFSFSDLLSFSGDIADKNLQIGGYFIIIGLLHSLISIIIASLFQIFENIRIFNKFTMRVMSSISLLFVVIGFFMPIFSNQSGFELAKLLHDIKIYNLNSISIMLYVLFITSLLGSLLFIPIIMNKKLFIGFDWIPIIINIGCFVCLKGLLSFSGDIADKNLQIGGCFIIIGLLHSLISLIIASIFQIFESIRVFNKFTMRVMGSISLLFIVIGFFMPVAVNQSGFDLAKLLHDIEIYNLNSISITLYVLFIISLLGSLLCIPIIMNKKLSIVFDWIPIIVNIGCFIYILIFFNILKKDILLSFSENIVSINLQIGGCFMIIGFLYSIISIGIASIFQFYESRNIYLKDNIKVSDIAYSHKQQ
jgi:hypothetical protein